MKGNKHMTSMSGKSITAAIGIGVITASILGVALTALLTKFVLNGRLDEKSIGATIFVIRAVSLMVGALIGGAVAKQKILLQVGLTTIGYMVILLAIGIVFYDGSVKHFLSGAVSVSVGGGAALVILLRPKKKIHKPKKYG